MPPKPKQINYSVSQSQSVSLKGRKRPLEAETQGSINRPVDRIKAKKRLRRSKDIEECISRTSDPIKVPTSPPTSPINSIDSELKMTFPTEYTETHICNNEFSEHIEETRELREIDQELLQYSLCIHVQTILKYILQKISMEDDRREHERREYEREQLREDKFLIDLILISVMLPLITMTH